MESHKFFESKLNALEEEQSKVEPEPEQIVVKGAGKVLNWHLPSATESPS